MAISCHKCNARRSKSLTYVSFMLLILQGDSSDIRDAAAYAPHLYEQIKYVPRTTDWENLPDTKRKQNDDKNDININRKTSFKHHGPLITPPWRFAPKRETISLLVSTGQTQRQE